MLCDEGHRLKNAYGTSTTLALGNCCAVRRLLLTGKQSRAQQSRAEQGRAGQDCYSLCLMYPLLLLLYHLSPSRAPPTSTASASSYLFFSPPYSLPPSLPLSLPLLLLSYSLNRLRLPLALPSTGTPIQNNLDELYSVVHFVAPGYLGELADFQRTFSDPISKGQVHGASELHKKKVCIILFLDGCYLLVLLLQCHFHIQFSGSICFCYCLEA